MQPLHKQSAADRAYMVAELFPVLPNFPKNFEFPGLVDPHHVIETNIIYVLVTAVFCVLITGTVASTRFYVRWNQNFGMDDWLMIPAFASYCIFSLVNLIGCFASGVGYHIYDLSLTDLHAGLIIQYMHTVLWGIVLHCTRISVLFLFLRVTGRTGSKKVRRYLQLMIVLSAGLLIATTVVLVFECSPVRNSFDLRARVTGSCMGTRDIKLYAGLACGHIALDLFTLVPPIFVIAKLAMERSKKVNLFILLSLGIASAVCTLVRTFVYYNKLVHGWDAMWDATAVGFWGVLEASLAVTVACLPAINHVLSARWAKSVQPIIEKISGTVNTNSKFDTTWTSSHSAPLETPATGGNGNSVRIYCGPSKNVSYDASARADGTLTTYREIEMDGLEGGRSTERLGDFIQAVGKNDITVNREVEISSEDVASSRVSASTSRPSHDHVQQGA